MSPRSVFQSRMVERLGGPLMAAVTSNPETAGPAAATAMAEMLARSVQLGIAFGHSMDLRGGDEGDAIRLVLTALAGRLVADLYRQTGQVPSEADTRRLVPAMEAVLSFSDRFAPSAEATLRLDNLEPGQAGMDESQSVVQTMQVFAPVIIEIASYSFGRAERKMAQEVTERLCDRAESMRNVLFPQAGEDAARPLELGLLRALCEIYVACHRAEQARLMAMDESGRAALAGAGGDLPLGMMWQKFEESAAMLETLSAGLTGGRTGGANAPMPVRPPAPPAAQAAEELKPQPAAAPAQPAAPAAKPASPMGFFKPGVKKPGTENNDSGAA